MRILRFALAAAGLTLAVIGPIIGPAGAQVIQSAPVIGENYAPKPIAIPDFKGATPQAQSIAAQMSDVVRNDLAGSGIFRLIDKAAYVEKDLDINTTPRFADWTVIQAQNLVVGNVAFDAHGNLVTQFRIYDTFLSKELFGQQYAAATPDDWRHVAHKVADDIYSQLTGEQGYFDSRIVFVAESGPNTDRKRRLAVMDQDGANAEHLLGGVSNVVNARFSPSSQTIIYTAYVPDPKNPTVTRLRVYLYDIETGRQEVLSELANGLQYAARFSPDGKSVVMSREEHGNSDIYVMDLARRIETRLTTSPAIDTSPSYSPDGKMIVFNSDRSGTPQLYIMRSDGGSMSCPNGGSDTACRISFGEGRYSTPVWSPRGDWIAFTKQTGSNFGIGVLQPDGKGERMLTESYLDEAPTWSPNGRVIAFTREAGPGAGDKLWSIDLTGRNLKRLPTPPGDASEPAWSPLLR